MIHWTLTHAAIRRLLVGAAALVAIAAFAGVARAESDVEPVPVEQSEAVPNYAEQRRSDLRDRARVRRILGYIGAGTLLGAYGGGLAFSAIDGFDNGKKAMWIPMAGPWVTLAKRHPRCDERYGDGGCWEGFLDVYTVLILAVDGVAQAVGAGLLVTAIVVPDPKPHWDATVTIVPYARPGAGGLVFAGVF
jgi:hypothetical protein